MNSENQAILKLKQRSKLATFDCTKLEDLMFCYNDFDLTKADIWLFMNLCVWAANNSISIKMNIKGISSLIGNCENGVYLQILRLRAADLVRKREDGFMINPDYLKFGTKQMQALQRVNWAKLKPHSKAETHSVEVLKKEKLSFIA